MIKTSRGFQVFVKPAGSVCNLGCDYCYYLDKEDIYPAGKSFRMADDLLEKYIVQHMEAFPEQEIRFTWHGGEPTLMGLDFFQRVVELQQKFKPPEKRISNGIQTNGILLNNDWCRFLSDEKFNVGISIDGPEDLHDIHRLTKNGNPSFENTIRGYDLLSKYNIDLDILCVVNSTNVREPSRVYGFFRDIGAEYISFLPLVERDTESESGVSPRSVRSEQWGRFLCTVFDEWKDRDIGRIKVQIFEEAARTAFNQDHSLCIFRQTCGDIPVIEHNGDFYPCDHYVESSRLAGNINETHLGSLLESQSQRDFGQAKRDTLPRYCRECEVLDICNGECPKNRFIKTPDGKNGLNYLCEGYKRFFKHCQPFVRELASVWRRTSTEDRLESDQTYRSNPSAKTGRNESCPCGSGKKYKHCCLNKN
ncbi:MAG: anaerobic sulfatase maturase [bacterium]|nr:anaerobic sulfatase maturase [bacterium]